MDLELKNFLRFRFPLFRPERQPKTAILIVSGGDGPAADRWLHICLRHISLNTRKTDYRIYLWNNNFKDKSIIEVLKIYPGIKLVNAAAGEKLKHPHASPLQKLYEIARKDNMQYIVTLDTDAFPVKDHWLSYLLRRLDDQTVLAGVWRDELKEAIEPYIHPSCLCTTVDFIEKNKLRFDDVDISPKKKLDTLSGFTLAALSNNKKMFKLFRSNKNQFHYIMGGLYGDLIYHHGAGSRKYISFWGEEKRDTLYLKNKTINQSLRHMVFHHERYYIDWLMGNAPEKSTLKSGCAEFYNEVENLKSALAEMGMNDA